jgi:hypothetical protein
MSYGKVAIVTQNYPIHVIDLKTHRSKSFNTLINNNYYEMRGFIFQIATVLGRGIKESSGLQRDVFLCLFK